MPAVWRIDLLGTLQATCGEQVVRRFRTRRVAALLARLALSPGRMYPRDELATLFWPDQDIEIARRNLRQALFSLRGSLEVEGVPGSILEAFHDSVQISAGVIETDVEIFLEQVRLAETAPEHERSIEFAREAVSLYRGELLPGFNEEWIVLERIRLDSIYSRTLKMVAFSLLADKNPEAIDHIRTGLVLEPLDEDWNLLMMRFHLESGAPEESVHHFKIYAERLGVETGRDPSDNAETLFRMARQDILTDRRRRSDMRSNLPELFKSRFIGRETSISELKFLYGEEPPRLLSLVGTPGVGKTRLALELASELGERVGARWFVPLADCADQTCLVDTIVSSIAPGRAFSAGSLAEIERVMPSGPNLIVLDSVEKVVDEVSEMLTLLADRRPDVSWLVTSRQPLHLEDERVFHVEPLVTLAQENRPSESAQLFLDRIKARRVEGTDATGVGEIEELCRRLEGIPLAIEMLASLSDSFTVAQMLNNFPLSLAAVETKRKNVPERHRSLRAAIDYSVASMHPVLQDLFVRLFIFRGSFTAEAAASIYQASQSDLDSKASSSSILTQLIQLNDLSLLQVDSGSGSEVRFRMLNIFRDYCEERLGVDQLSRVRSAHAEYFLARVPVEDSRSTISTVASEHLDIETEYADFSASIEYFFAKERISECVQLLSALSVRWQTHGPKAFERKFIRKVADHPGLRKLDPYLRVRILRMLGTTYIRSSEYLLAYEALQNSVEVARSTGDSELIATTYSGLSICAGYLGRMEECLELNYAVLDLVDSENFRLRERSYLGIGSVRWNQGRLLEAQEAFTQALDCSKRRPNGEPDLLILVNLARVALDLDLFDQSSRLLGECLRLARRRSDEFGLAITLTVESRLHWRLGRYGQAIETNLTALAKCRDGDFSFWILHCIRHAALILTSAGSYSDAAILFAATEDFRKMNRSLDEIDHEFSVGEIKKHLMSSELDRAWSAGSMMGLEEAAVFAVETSQEIVSRRDP